MASAFDDILGPPPAAPSVAKGSAFDDILGAAPAPAAPVKPAENYKFDESTEDDGPGLLESVARGAKQGVTLGFGDELTGAIESALTTKTYEQARDEARANDDAAKKAHRWGFGIGEALGGAAVPIPGLGAAGALKGVAGLAARGAIAGGVAGLGNSEADLTKGDIGGAAKDVAYGAGLGAVLGAGVGAVGNKVVGGAERRSAARALAEGEPGGKVAKAIDVAHLFASPGGFVAKKAGGAAIRGADEMLAGIARAARAGKPTAQMVQGALEAGVPRSAIAAAVTGAGEVTDE